MKPIILLASAVLLTGLPVQSETVYLVVKSKSGGGSYSGVTLYSIPMTSVDQCQEQGALLVTNESFHLSNADQDAFACITGK